MVTHIAPGLGDAVDDRRVEFLGDVDDATTEVRVRGRWSAGLALDLTHGVRKALIEAPRAVLLDLSGLEDPAGTCIPTLIDGYRSAATAPRPVRLVLCGPRGGLYARLRAVGIGSAIPIFPTTEQARTALRGTAMLPAMSRLDLAPEPVSAALARDVIGQACADWHLGHLLHPARVVVSELALNAIEHAPGPFSVTVSLRRPILHIAVRDRDPSLPRLRDPGPYDPVSPLADRGRGLRLVASYAAAWGAMPCRMGKVVWATLSTRTVRA